MGQDVESHQEECLLAHHDKPTSSRTSLSEYDIEYSSFRRKERRSCQSVVHNVTKLGVVLLVVASLVMNIWIAVAWSDLLRTARPHEHDEASKGGNSVTYTYCTFTTKDDPRLGFASSALNSKCSEARTDVMVSKPRPIRLLNTSSRASASRIMTTRTTVRRMKHWIEHGQSFSSLSIFESLRRSCERQEDNPLNCMTGETNTLDTLKSIISFTA